MTDTETKTQTQTFEFNPPELTFLYITDEELANLIVKHSDFTKKQIVEQCKWFEGDRNFEVITKCTKSGKPVINFEEERDFITYLVQQNVLPEGNYLLRIT